MTAYSQSAQRYAGTHPWVELEKRRTPTQRCLRCGCLRFAAQSPHGGPLYQMPGREPVDEQPECER